MSSGTPVVALYRLSLSLVGADTPPCGFSGTGFGTRRARRGAGGSRWLQESREVQTRDCLLTRRGVRGAGHKPRGSRARGRGVLLPEQGEGGREVGSVVSAVGGGAGRGEEGAAGVGGQARRDGQRRAEPR
eukprot:1553540-Rhodomonas_salina.2